MHQLPVNPGEPSVHHFTTSRRPIPSDVNLHAAPGGIPRLDPTGLGTLIPPPGPSSDLAHQSGLNHRIAYLGDQLADPALDTADVTVERQESALDQDTGVLDID